MGLSNLTPLIASLLLFNLLTTGCKKEESKKSVKGGADATATPASTQQLDGEWQSDCKASVVDGSPSATIIKLKFSNSKDYTSTVTVFEGSTCEQEKLLSTVEVDGGYTLGKVVSLLEAVEIDFTNVTNRLKFHRKEIIDAYNQTKLCGGGWVINQARSITPENCPSANVQQQPVELQVVKIEAQQLVLGKKVGNSSQQRPGTLDPDFVYKKL
jgi:hypothetical protein